MMAPFRSTVLAALCVLASGSTWSQFYVNTLFNPPPDDFFEILVTTSFPDPGAFTPEITVDGAEVTIDLHAECVTSCPPSLATTLTFTVPPLPAGQYTMTVYLNRCCRGQSAKLQLVIGEETPSSVSYQGLWLDPVEPGWGVNLTHQGSILFLTWFTYDRDGTGLWVSASATRDRSGRYVGPLYRTRGPAFNADPFTPIGFTDYTQVGTVSLSFTDASAGAMTYTLDDVTQSKPIARYVFGSSGVDCALGDRPDGYVTNLTDLWLNSPQGSESQAGGKGQWLVMSNLAKTGPGIYSGAIQRTTGPAFNAVPFNPALVRRTTVGTATFSVSDADNATFVYTLDGVSQFKPLVRYVFSSPVTVCQ